MSKYKEFDDVFDTLIDSYEDDMREWLRKMGCEEETATHASSVVVGQEVEGRPPLAVAAPISSGRGAFRPVGGEVFPFRRGTAVPVVADSEGEDGGIVLSDVNVSIGSVVAGEGGEDDSYNVREEELERISPEADPETMAEVDELISGVVADFLFGKGLFSF